MPSIELIAVGTELLLGQLVDTNTPFIELECAAAGVDVRATHCVGDNQERIAGAILGALGRAEGVVMTGGLGPTTDDVTKEAVCDALALGVETYLPALEQMEKAFARLGRPMRENNRKQAELPKGSRPLDNPRGTAPGFIAFAADGRFVACMPGVPREMKPMLREQVIPFLRERLHAEGGIVTRVIHTIGLGESEVDHRIADLFRSSENPKIAVLAHDFRVDVKIMAKSGSPARAREMIAPLQREIEQRLRGGVFGTDEATPASAILELMRLRRRKLAIAESCTGGRIAAAITSIPGASESFVGAVVAYDNAVKTGELDVALESLERYGAVSEQVAIEMACGIRRRLGADVAVSTTGVAGPGGGTPEKPVGLVWIALDDSEHGAHARRFQLEGNREDVVQRATTIALNLLWRNEARQESP